jgi:hypothetical protein
VKKTSTASWAVVGFGERGAVCQRRDGRQFSGHVTSEYLDLCCAKAPLSITPVAGGSCTLLARTSTTKNRCTAPSRLTDSKSNRPIALSSGHDGRSNGRCQRFQVWLRPKAMRLISLNLALPPLLFLPRVWEAEARICETVFASNSPFFAHQQTGLPTASGQLSFLL